MCIQDATSTSSSTPASIIAFEPKKASSFGWNINLTLPSNSSTFSFSICAAPNNIAVCISCPQLCAAFVLDANSKTFSSFIDNASISARSR